MSLAKLLKSIIDNPEDLSTLPQAVELATKLEEENTSYLDRIATLQDNYRKLLQMVPIPGNEPEPEPEPEPMPTPEQAVAEILEEMKNY